jgi:hypothetical protein
VESRSAPLPFAVELSRTEAGGLRLAVTGDFTHLPSLAAALDDVIAAAEDVLLDLGRCELVDTTAIAAIVDAARRL